MYYQLDGTNVRLLGSIHLFPKDASSAPARIEQAYTWAESICIKHDGRKLAPLMQLGDGRDLEREVPAKTWKLLASLWPHEDLSGLRPLKLWAAFILTARAALDAVDGVEGPLLQRLRDEGRPVQSLETDEELAMVFDAMPPASLAEAIAHHADSPEAVRAGFRRSHEAWVAGDLEALRAAQADTPLLKMPELHRPMFLVRNQLWAERIAPVAPQQEKKTLIIVGAGHMVGPGSLLERLHEQGCGTTLIA